MPNWLESMKQSFAYFTVDPGTWKDTVQLQHVKSCTVDRDAEAETLGSASFEAEDFVGEGYIRVYLITEQKGIREQHPLGTFLVQTPVSTFDGKVRDVSMDAYTPLLELKDALPPLGYAVAKRENIMDIAYRIAREQARAPVIAAKSDTILYENFVADTSDTWLSFLLDFMAGAGYGFALDEMGRILFSPKQDTASLQPVRTYDDGDISILFPEIDVTHDLYGVPNVVEVVYSSGSTNSYARAVNDDPNSPISTVNRGREIVHRITDPDLAGEPTESQLTEYAKQQLRELSALEYTITYTHGYCPVQIGDCVRLNYKRAGIQGLKAKVVKQSIACKPGCPVTETAVFNVKLWG